MSARRLLLPALAVAVALAAALAVLPARWLIRIVPRDWPMAVVDASGTVWNGRARLALGQPGLRRTLPDPVAWQWHWVDGVGISARISHPWLAAPLEVAPGLAGVRLGKGKAALPATALLAIGAPFNTLEPGGELALAWPAMTLGGRPPAGPLLQLTWSRASSARVRVQPLGDYRVSLASDGGKGLDLRIQTLQGPLRIEGAGHGSGSRWRFDGQAQPAPDTDPATRDALVPLLGTLGAYRGGVSRLQFP